MKKTILITGAASGFGKDAAFELAKRGHNVIATTHTEEEARKLGPPAFKLDITNAEDREKIAGLNLDVLINNAGIGETGPLAEVPMERVIKNFEVNVFATLAITQIALKNMVKQGRGTIVTVSSLAGRIPQPFLGPYSMTKYALSGGMAALRVEMHELNPNIHVSLIEPGAYATGFNQRMFATKYEWLNEQSMFASLIPAMQHKDTKEFTRFEHASTQSLVRLIVEAAEATKPKLRYSAPRYQALYARLLRMLGK